MISRREALAQMAAAVALPALGSTAAFADKEIPTVEKSTLEPGLADRRYWVSVADRIARPVLAALANRRLKATMPVERKTPDRPHFTHLEAIGRLLCGISPWLELGPDDTPEGRLRGELADLARRAIDSGTDPASPDHLNFSDGGQPLVDTAFLAQAILRAPVELWGKLPDNVKANLIASLAASRVIVPGENNWQLFRAMVETALAKLGHPWDMAFIAVPVGLHAKWYVGDGSYGDGPQYHWDYYNSFVIQPMLVEVLYQMQGKGDFGLTYDVVLKRARRWATVQEREISPEGTFPAVGRSLAYRFGALQGLALMSLKHELSTEIVPAQVRCAMTAVIKRMIEAPGTFDANGWLKIGFCGAQPSLGEGYISTGSLYLCSAGLLPLGLPPADPFWAAPPAPWTSQKAWAGVDIPTDHAI
jgi:hypothetical protein